MNMTPILRHDCCSHCDGYENRNWSRDLDWNHQSEERYADEGFAKPQGGTYECGNENRRSYTQCRWVNDQKNTPSLNSTEHKDSLWFWYVSSLKGPLYIRDEVH